MRNLALYSSGLLWLNSHTFFLWIVLCIVKTHQILNPGILPVLSLVSPRIDVYCRCTTSCNLYISGGSPVCRLPETTAYICRCMSFLNLTLLPTPAPEIYTSPVRYLPESTSLPVCNRLELLAPVMSHWILHVLLFISSRLVISRCVNPGASLPFKVLPPRMYALSRPSAAGIFIVF